MSDVDNIREPLIAGDIHRLVESVQSAIDQGISAKDILNNGLIAAMDVVGDKMESGEMFIPEVLRCAKAMSQAVDILKPLLSAEDSSAVGKILIGTVKGDLHDIGKNLVSMMLESGGFDLIDLGVDTAPETFIDSIGEHQPQILGLSALLTTTMPMMRQTIEAIKDAGLRSGLKIIVGGAPITQSFAEEIGADGYAPDAGSAVKLCKRFVNGS